MVFFGRIIYARIALDSATYDCARSAVESLRYHRAIEQASYVGWNTLSGFYLDASDVEFGISHAIGYGRWYRGTEVTCSARLNVRVDEFALCWFAVFRQSSTFVLQNYVTGGEICQLLAMVEHG